MVSNINADFGEGYGDLLYGNDAGLMPFVHSANVACGFHGGDPDTIARTLDLAQEHGVRVGAHPSLPDRAGFGRREMKIKPDELRNLFIYQIGALKAFLDMRGMPLSHVKPHGKIYTMSRLDADLAAAVLDACAVFRVPLITMAGSETLKLARKRGVPILVEYCVDLDYRDDGSFTIDKTRPVDVDLAVAQAVGMVRDGAINTITGGKLAVEAQIVCLHNDMSNAVDVARAVRAALDVLD